MRKFLIQNRHLAQRAKRQLAIQRVMADMLAKMSEMYILAAEDKTSLYDEMAEHVGGKGLRAYSIIVVDTDKGIIELKRDGKAKE